MALSKFTKMVAFTPDLLRPSVNPMNRGLLYTWSKEDDNIVQSIKDAREQIFLVSAQFRYLNVIGSNVGVFRPTEFNMADALYRRMIPALSFWPKQVRPTIKEVLDIFFEDNNPKVSIAEVSPNEINIRIPNSVPFLRRGLRGAHHIHNYYGEIINVDNTLKELTINVYGEKYLQLDELKDAFIGQDLKSAVCLSSTAGNAGVILQFSAGEDLSPFQVGEEWVAVKPNYPGSFIPDPTSPYTVTGSRGILGQAITAGTQVPTLIMSDSSNIPDSVGRLIFNFGKGTEESLVKYYGRPNNSTILLDPGHTFQYDHAIGEPINLVLTPYKKPRKNGSDYSVYFTGVVAARILAQRIVESIVAAGVVVNWDIIVPEINC